MLSEGDGKPTVWEDRRALLEDPDGVWTAWWPVTRMGLLYARSGGGRSAGPVVAAELVLSELEYSQWLR